MLYQESQQVIEPRTEIEEEEKDHSQPGIIDDYRILAAAVRLENHELFEAKQLTEDNGCSNDFAADYYNDDDDFLNQVDQTSLITPCQAGSASHFGE